VGHQEKHFISYLGLLKITMVLESLESVIATWAELREIKKDCESEKNP